MARKPDDWMPLHIGKYMAKTFGLTRDQHGAYLLLLMAYWTNGGPLDADDAALAACAKASPSEWRKLRPIMAKFFTEENGKWVQSKADKELTKAVALTEAKAAAGKAGAAARWQNDGTGNGKRMADASNSHRQMHRQTDAPLPQPRTKTEGLSFVVGKGAASRPALDPGERLNRFQKTIAEALGPAGYSIVAAASDPESPLYERSVALCKAKASELGKGWPHHWPAPEAA